MVVPESGSTTQAQSSTRGDIVVVESNAHGHRLYYVRVLALASPRPLIWMTSLGALNSDEAQLHLGDLLAAGQVSPRVLSDWRSRARVLRESTRHDERRRGDSLTVVIPDGDRWLLSLAWSLLRSSPDVHWTALVLRPPSRWRETSLGRIPIEVGKRASIRLVRGASRAFKRQTRVAGLADAFGYVPANTSGLVSVRDPVLPRQMATVAEARAELGIPPDSFVVGVLGHVDRRKNLLLVGQAVSALDDEMRPVLLVCGRVAADVVATLSTLALGDRLIMIDRYVSEHELAMAAASCDVIAAMYDNHGSASGILALAAQASRPIVVPRGRRLGAAVARSGAGDVADLTVESLVAALYTVRDRSSQLNGRAEEAARLLGTRQFTDVLLGRPR